MRIAIACDHAGFSLKERLMKALQKLSHDVSDFGTFSSEEPVDYPDYAAKAAQAVASGEAERAVLVCGSGIGMSMAANRFEGVRAALCRSPQDAEAARRHNDANALALGERFTPPELAEKILRVWLDTPFEGGRHERRVKKIEKAPLGKRP